MDFSCILRMCNVCSPPMMVSPRASHLSAFRRRAFPNEHAEGIAVGWSGQTIVAPFDESGCIRSDRCSSILASSPRKAEEISGGYLPALLRLYLNVQLYRTDCVVWFGGGTNELV